MNIQSIYRSNKRRIRVVVTQRLVATGLLMLINGGQFAVAAAPSKPVSETPEEISKMTSLEAQTPFQEIDDIITVTATGYSSTPDQTDDTPFITASGETVRDGIIAANFLPFNTRVQLPELFGDKIFIVKDRMHPRFDSGRIDIWFADRDLAKHFGVKEVAAIVLK